MILLLVQWSVELGSEKLDARIFGHIFGRVFALNCGALDGSRFRKKILICARRRERYLAVDLAVGGGDGDRRCSNSAALHALRRKVGGPDVGRDGLTRGRRSTGLRYGCDAGEDGRVSCVLELMAQGHDT